MGSKLKIIKSPDGKLNIIWVDENTGKRRESGKEILERIEKRRGLTERMGGVFK